MQCGLSIDQKNLFGLKGVWTGEGFWLETEEVVRGEQTRAALAIRLGTQKHTRKISLCLSMGSIVPTPMTLDNF